jgi:hypothetical protein
MSTDTIKWIEINWKVLDTINDNRSIIGSIEVTWHWNKHKQRIEHEYSIAAWALCIMVSVQTDVRD